MPKIERLSWLAPLAEGRGITLSDDPAADLYLAENPNALLLGVLYDSQFATRRAFAAPLRLRERLGHLDMLLLAAEDTTPLMAAFSQKPALHRFPNKFATLTQKLAGVVATRYGGDAGRIWMESADVEDLSKRLMDLPSFGVEKTNWTIGMLGTLEILQYDGWDGYQVPARKRPIKAPGDGGTRAE